MFTRLQLWKEDGLKGSKTVQLDGEYTVDLSGWETEASLCLGGLGVSGRISR